MNEPAETSVRVSAEISWWSYNQSWNLICIEHDNFSFVCYPVAVTIFWFLWYVVDRPPHRRTGKTLYTLWMRLLLLWDLGNSKVSCLFMLDLLGLQTQWKLWFSLLWDRRSSPSGISHQAKRVCYQLLFLVACLLDHFFGDSFQIIMEGGKPSFPPLFLALIICCALSIIFTVSLTCKVKNPS